MNVIRENRTETKQKKGFDRRIAALLALCVVSAVYGNPATVYEFRPIGVVSLKLID